MKLVIITYLIYVIIWDAMIIGGFGYVIFGLGYSGWWAVVALFMLEAGYKPGRWRDLVEGKDSDK